MQLLAGHVVVQAAEQKNFEELFAPLLYQQLPMLQLVLEGGLDLELQLVLLEQHLFLQPEQGAG